MAFPQSPGVTVQEFDLTTTIAGASSTEAGFAAPFIWGPAGERVLVDSENKLRTIFGIPSYSVIGATGSVVQAQYWFSAAAFLAYSNSLRISRVISDESLNAVCSGTAIQIKNSDTYEQSYEDGQANVGPWAAKYPGAIGNSLRVELADSVGWQRTLAGTLSVTSGSKAVTGTTTTFTTTTSVGELLYDNASGKLIGQIDVITDDTHIVLVANTTQAFTAVTAVAKWQYQNLFDSAPSTSDWVSATGGSSDELHAIVIDEDGIFTGTPETVLEKFAFLSKASDAKYDDGSTSYYKTVINRDSSYIWWMDHSTVFTNAGSVSTGIAFVKSTKSIVNSLVSGTDGFSTTDVGDFYLALDQFVNSEDVDISLLFMGPASYQVTQYAIDNVAEVRRDCVVFCSPELGDCRGTGIADKIVARKNSSSTGINRSTSFGFMDSNWKYFYDKYNDKYIWIPVNADIAGLAARTDDLRDPWWSPAGFERGVLKNVIKLAWTPSKAERDVLYKAGVNPVLSFSGSGPILYGDKTMLDRANSAFTRLNVRRLFIVLEKSISDAAKYSLFEFNDEFTRAGFVNMVTPFLRTVKGRRGVYDFRVICDETNNTPEVIDSFEFRGDIYIKPARAINFIVLSFVAAKTGVDFNEIQLNT